MDETLRAVLAATAWTSLAMPRPPRRWARAELDQTLLIDPARVTCGVFHAMNPDVPRVEAINPSTPLLESRKTEAEQANVRQAMEQDGAALCEFFFAWFEGALGKERITELTIDGTDHRGPRAPARLCSSQLRHHRRFQRQRHAALPRHRRSHAVIEGDGLLPIDSGGQYLGGTTTSPAGCRARASADQKVDFTLVLKGMIAVARVFWRHPVAHAGRHRARADLGRRRRVRPRHGHGGLFPERARRPAGDFVPRGARLRTRRWSRA